MTETPWLRLLRPKQWLKNGFVFAPLFFAPKFMEPHAWYLTIVAALAFLCVSCTVYVGNDLKDADEDRRHPVKKQRPIARGEITANHAMLLGAGMAALGLLLLTRLPQACATIIAVYVWLNIAYTFRLKHVAILDIFFIAVCYVLRVLMGCAALAVVVSPWIILTTFLLALFLGFGKRYHEMSISSYVRIKPNLQNYSRDFLDRMVMISGGAALMAYAIYAAEIAHRIGKVEMIYTVAFVAFGLFRYLQCIYVFGQGGEPEEVILKDKWQLANVVLWLVVTLAIMF